jgi:uncharacterized protein DUF5677
MTLLQVTKQSVALLRRILEQERDRFAKEDFLLTSSPPAFIYLHARNICELGDDVVALEAGNRSRAARILMRPMLESLFSLLAAVKDPSFPARKIVAEQEDEIERIKIWSEEDHEHDFGDKFQEAKQQICDLRRKPSITEKKKWNARETAGKAALGWHYKGDYFSSSGNIYSKAACLMFYELQLDSEISLISTVFIVLTTVDQIAVTKRGCRQHQTRNNRGFLRR